MNFDEQVLDDYFHKSFKKIRITNRIKKKSSKIHDLMDKRSHLKKKSSLVEKDEQELIEIEAMIAEECQDAYHK